MASRNPDTPSKLRSPQPGEPRFEWHETPDTVEVFTLSAAEAIIGRRVGVEIFLAHPLVSRQHARVIREDDGFVVVDLGSSHGTWVNGNRVDRHRLQSRDKVRLGQLGIELLYLDAGDQGEIPVPDKAPSQTRTSTSTATTLWEGMGVKRSAQRLASVLPEESADAHSELEKISCLLDFHYYFGKAFSAERTFQHILKSAISISGAERGFILRKQSNELVFAVGLDGAGNTLGATEFQTSGSVVEQVAKDGQPVFMTQGIHGDLAGSESIVAMNLRAIACLPLEAMSPDGDVPAVTGILYLDSRKHMHSLSGLDEKLLTRLAGEAGNVLEKLDMVVTLAEHKRIEQELAIAEETQRSLLPRSLPKAEPFLVRAFSRPTRHLGGDFYDFIAAGDRQLTGVLADVSGKGIPAALLSSLTLGALNMEFRRSGDGGRVLNQVNKLLCEKTPAHRFVTMFLFQLNADGKGLYINAGHNPAYLFRSASGGIEELPSGGMPLGMFPFASYEPVAMELNPGDLLVVYSDGLSEAENDAQEQFSEERLQGLIRAEGRNGVDSMESTLLAELDKFTQGAMQSDDITFLLIQNGGTPVPSGTGT